MTEQLSSHAFIQLELLMKVKVKVSSVSVMSDSLQPHGCKKSDTTLRQTHQTHRTCQAPLSMGFPRQQYWSGLPFPSPEYLPDPGIELWSPTLQMDSLPPEPLGKQRTLHILITASLLEAVKPQVCTSRIHLFLIL